jgi:hypothetical protein
LSESKAIVVECRLDFNNALTHPRAFFLRHIKTDPVKESNILEMKLPFHKLKCAFSPLMENFCSATLLPIYLQVHKNILCEVFSLFKCAEVIKTVE